MRRLDTGRHSDEGGNAPSVRAWRGDITALSVDVIVNGANEALPGVSAPEVAERFLFRIDYSHHDNYCCEPDGVSPVG